MKHLLISTIAAVVLVGCGPSVDIHKAATVGNIEAVKQHLAAGVDVDVKAERYDEWTPLHYAAYSSQKEVAELLIDKGADVNAKDKNGKTPLDWAVDSPFSDEETADLLRKHGGKTGEELKAEGK